MKDVGIIENYLLTLMSISASFVCQKRFNPRKMYIPRNEGDIIEEIEKVDITCGEKREPSAKTYIIIGKLTGALRDHIVSQKKYECDTKELLQDIQKKLEEMAPSYKMIKNFETTGEVIGKTGKVILTILLFLSAIIGAIYSFKNWILK